MVHFLNTMPILQFHSSDLARRSFCEMNPHIFSWLLKSFIHNLSAWSTLNLVARAKYQGGVLLVIISRTCKGILRFTDLYQWKRGIPRTRKTAYSRKSYNKHPYILRLEGMTIVLVCPCDNDGYCLSCTCLVIDLMRYCELKYEVGRRDIY